jgi:hypothetical protein
MNYSRELLVGVIFGFWNFRFVHELQPASLVKRKKIGFEVFGRVVILRPGFGAEVPGVEIF